MLWVLAEFVRSCFFNYFVVVRQNYATGQTGGGVSTMKRTLHTPEQIIRMVEPKASASQ
jgi:hypothetical protein